MQNKTDPVQLEKLSEIRQLAVGVAHEIWNPLAVIKTMMFAMRVDVRPEDPRCADFDVINKQVDRMERSIQRFLDSTWPPAPILAPVILGQIVAHAVDLLRHKAVVQGVQVEVSVAPDLVILADQGQIEQVCVNLALNALQAMPEGGKLSIVAKPEPRFVNLSLKALPARPKAVKAGIPEELVDRIFEPVVSERGDELGLGLAIVQQLVERHGGQIAAHNRPEGGAIFTLLLPLVEV